MTGPLAGKACVVTGANAGIGFEIAKGLANASAEVAMVCRNPERGEAARTAIAAATGNNNLTLFRADLGVQDDVRRVADEIAARFPEVTVLMNNAGTAQGHRTLTTDGLETTFAVNHLGPFLLTHLLLDKVKAAAPSRIVTVASAAHRRAELDFDNLQGERRYSVRGAYSRSKLANILFTRELARRLKGTGVVANCVHPGVVNTGIWQVNWLMRLIAPVMGRMLRTPAHGAETPLYAALDARAGQVSGVYLVDRKPTPTSRAAEDMLVALRLWEASEQLTGVEWSNSRR